MALELAQRGLGRERVDQAHVRDDLAHPPALELADEVPFEELAVCGDLLLELLRAVLAHQANARLGEPRQLVGGEVLDRREDLHLALRVGGALERSDDVRADAFEVGVYPACVEARDQLNHAIPAWRPARAPSRLYEK